MGLCAFSRPPTFARPMGTFGAHAGPAAAAEQVSMEHHSSVDLRALAVQALAKVAQDTASVEPEIIAGRSSALKALGRAAEEGDGFALAVLVAAIDDWHVQVRSVALRALCKVVRQGDPRAVHTRLGALLALVPSVRAGDELAVGATVAALEDPAAEVQDAAASTLCSLAVQGRGVVGAERRARIAGLGCLHRAACEGDERAGATLAACMQDWDIYVRSAAIEAVIGLAEGRFGSDHCGVVAVSPRVRWGAIEALSPLAMTGDKRALEALVTCLRIAPEEEDGAAGVALALAARSSEALAQVLREADSSVPSRAAGKVVAAEAIARSIVAGGAGGEWMVAALAACAEDWHVGPRQAALRALAEVTMSNAASVCLAAQGAALHALMPAAMRGDATALGALTAKSVAAPHGF